MTTLAQYEQECGAAADPRALTYRNLVESVMSTNRFAIPSQRLRRGWDFGPDYARVVEARVMSEDEYDSAHAGVGSVYFIGEQLGGDALKIGWSRAPARRLQEIQVGNPSPLKIVGCVAATRLIEPALHQLFALSAVSGEWFTDPESSIRRWLGEMTFGHPICRARWFMAGAQCVTWHWDEKALLHMPIFAGAPA